MRLSSPLGVVEYSQDYMLKITRLRSVGRWLCPDVCLSNCRYEVLALMAYLSDVLLLGPAVCIPFVVYVIVSMFDLSNLGSCRSEGASGRT